jgi:hypothetical protein
MFVLYTLQEGMEHANMYHYDTTKANFKKSNGEFLLVFAYT